MASKLMRVIITGDVKGAVKSFAELDMAAGKTEMTMGQRFQALGKMAGVAIGAGVVAAGVGLFKLGESFDEVYDRIRVSTGATGDTLNGLKDDFRAVVADVPTDFNSAGNAIATINQKLGLTGQPLQDLAGQFLNVSRITKTDLTENLKAGTDVLNAFGIEAKDQPAILDQMYRAAQASGLSFTDMLTRTRDAGTQLRGLGLDATEAAALVATLGKAGIDTSEVLPGISRALAEAAKAGVPANEFFGNFIDTIKNAPDATAAAGLAVDVLGSKSGQKFAQLVREGKLSYDDMLSSITGGKDTINKAAGETEDFSEKWQRFKNQGMLALEPVATRVFDIVGKGMDYLSEHKPMLIAVAAVIGTVLVAAFTAWAIAAATAAVNTLIAAAPILAIIAVIALVVAAIIFFATKWDEIWAKVKEVVGAAVEFIKSVAGAALEWLKGAFSTVFDAIKSVVSGAVDWIKSNWDLLLAIFTGPIGLVILVIRRFGDDIVSAFSSVWNTVTGIVSGAWAWITGIVSSSVDSIVGFVTGLPGRLGDVGSAIANAITGAFKRAWNAVANAINDIIPNEIKIGWGPASYTINLPDNPIPRLAKGGIVTAPTLALIGEAGPEAVVPLNKANNPLMGSAGGDMTIVVQLDSGVLLRALVPKVNQQAQAGPVFVKAAIAS